MIVVYTAEPKFPASDQHPDAVRYRMTVAGRDVWVDATGGQPTAAEVAALLNPPHRVSKATVIARLIAVGKLDAAEAALAQDRSAYWRFQAAQELASDNAEARALLTAIGADPEAILAPEDAGA